VLVVARWADPHVAVPAWRPPRHAALGGLLDGTLQFGWGRRDVESDDRSSEIEVAFLERSGEVMP
jgi:hypothetical protein